MDISATSNRPLQALLPDTKSAPGKQENLAQARGAARSANPATTPASESIDVAADAQVTLTARPASKAGPVQFSPVYAEIWKDGTKVAEIDIHGGVTPVNRLIAAAQGTVGSSGAILAARRAAEIASAIGGEIRVGGQIVDSKTLDMRAKLKIAYGA